MTSNKPPMGGKLCPILATNLGNLQKCIGEECIFYQRIDTKLERCWVGGAGHTYYEEELTDV
jgi:hypothetical protein